MSRQRKNDSSYKAAHMCSYSYFPRVEGRLDDGINAFSMEFQQDEFSKISLLIFRNVLKPMEWKTM